MRSQPRMPAPFTELDRVMALETSRDSKWVPLQADSGKTGIISRQNPGLMFIGHFAAAFASKRVAPEASLGTLFLASQLPDLVWPTLVAFGIETVRIDPGNTAFTPLHFVSYPWSHSLVSSVLWALLVGGVYWLMRRSARGALTLGALVLSHWILDVVTHRPDLPVTLSGEHRVGLGLWNHVGATLLIESMLLAVGVTLYLTAIRPPSRSKKIIFWLLVAFLLGVYAANVLGPPPPSVPAIAVAGHATWLIVLWAYWADRATVSDV